MSDCIRCSNELIPGYASEGGNWPPSRQIRNSYVCSNCRRTEDQAWREDNPERNREFRRARDQAVNPGRVDYFVQHIRVTRVRGQASNHLCEGCCGSAAEQWAWIHGEDRDDVNSYVPLCIPCHVQYDLPLPQSA